MNISVSRDKALAALEGYTEASMLLTFTPRQLTGLVAVLTSEDGVFAVPVESEASKPFAFDPVEREWFAERIRASGETVVLYADDSRLSFDPVEKRKKAGSFERRKDSKTAQTRADNAMVIIQSALYRSAQYRGARPAVVFCADGWQIVTGLWDNTYVIIDDERTVVVDVHDNPMNKAAQAKTRTFAPLRISEYRALLALIDQTAPA